MASLSSNEEFGYLLQDSREAEAFLGSPQAHHSQTLLVDLLQLSSLHIQYVDARSGGWIYCWIQLLYVLEV